MIEYHNVIFTVDERIATLTINRPERLNALNPQTMEEIGRCIDAVDDDGDIRCVIVTGAGDKAFIAGADITAMVTMSGFEEKGFAADGLAVLRKFEQLRLPVIAAVNGYALGGGTELALACDLILASDNARFGLPEIKLGIIPGFGGTQRLPRRVGLLRAREMIYTGDMIDAETALRYGLVNHVYPAAELMTECRALARKLAGQAPLAMQQAKTAINAGIDVDLDNGLRFETEAVGLAFSTEDKREGMTAFLEKRKPRFKGV
jgi:enoyl-CoA hydratase